MCCKDTVKSLEALIESLPRTDTRYFDVFSVISGLTQTCPDSHPNYVHGANLGNVGTMTIQIKGGATFRDTLLKQAAKFLQ
jgi:hypothetical protein